MIMKKKYFYWLVTVILLLVSKNTLVGQGIVCNKDSLNKYEITSDKLNQLLEFTKQEYYPYGQGIIDRLIGQTNCAVISWVRYLTNRDYEAEVFNLQWPAFFSPVPFEMSEEVIDSVHLSNQKYFGQCSYNIYPSYSNCDVWNLIKQHKILLNYSLIQLNNSSISLHIECYFPWNDTDAPLSQSVSYMKLISTFSYTFAPSLTDIPDNFGEEIQEECKRSISLLQDDKLLKRIKQNIIESFYKNVIADYSWRLNMIQIGVIKIVFNENVASKRIEDLFRLL